MPWSLRSNGEAVDVSPFTRLVVSVNALNTGIEFARSGLGIIGTFGNWLDQDLKAGTLLPVLPNWWSELEGPRLYYPSRFAAAPLRAFIEICRERSP